MNHIIEEETTIRQPLADIEIRRVTAAAASAAAAAAAVHNEDCDEASAVNNDPRLQFVLCGQSLRRRQVAIHVSEE